MEAKRNLHEKYSYEEVFVLRESRIMSSAIDWIKTLASAALPVLFSALFYQVTLRTSFKKLKRWKQQLIIGVVFGLCSVSATFLGVTINGLILNVRDAAPICAALIFGGPAGILAGTIGAAGRLLTILWGQGTYSWLACSISCFLSGLIGAFFRHVFFDRRKPAWSLGILIAILMEIIHMLLILGTHLENTAQAVNFVSRAALPMIIANACSVGLSLFVVSRISRCQEKVQIQKHVGQSLQMWLSLCILAGFLMTSICSYMIQTIAANETVTNTLKSAIEEVQEEILMQSSLDPDDRTLSSSTMVSKSGPVLITDENYTVLADPFGRQGSSFEADLLSRLNAWQRYELMIDNTNCFLMYGTIDNYCIVAYMPVAEAFYNRNIVVYLTTFNEFIVFVCIYFLMYYILRKFVVKNIQDLNSSLDQISSGNLDVVLQIEGNEEFASVSSDINQTVGVLKSYVEDSENRLSRERDYARAMQKAAVPAVFPAFPEIEEFDLYAMVVPYREVGGSFYNYIMLSRRKICFVVGDVSGTGLPSAIFMVRAKSLLQAQVQSGENLSLVFRKVNEALCQDNRDKLQLSVWLGLLDLGTGRMEYVNCGHTRPVLTVGSKTMIPTTKVNAPLGLDPSEKFIINKIMLHPGDRLFLQTEGIINAKNQNGEPFGMSRLQKVLQKVQYESPKEVCDAVLACVQKFCTGVEQADDYTMFDLQLKSLETEDTIYLVPDDSSLEKALDFADKKGRDYKLSSQACQRIRLIVEELFANVIRYSGAKNASLAIRKDGAWIQIEIQDDGQPFDTRLIQVPNLNELNSERPGGGLNIFLIYQFASIDYNRTDETNLLAATFDSVNPSPYNKQRNTSRYSKSEDEESNENKK